MILCRRNVVAYRRPISPLLIVTLVFFQSGLFPADVAKFAVVLFVLSEQIAAGTAAVLDVPLAAGVGQTIVFFLIILKISIETIAEVTDAEVVFVPRFCVKFRLSKF